MFPCIRFSLLIKNVHKSFLHVLTIMYRTVVVVHLLYYGFRPNIYTQSEEQVQKTVLSILKRKTFCL